MCVYVYVRVDNVVWHNPRFAIGGLSGLVFTKRRSKPFLYIGTCKVAR